jgi:hypothetical protein
MKYHEVLAFYKMKFQKGIESLAGEKSTFNSLSQFLKLYIYIDLN